jgi:hypothetical protein
MIDPFGSDRNNETMHVKNGLNERWFLIKYPAAADFLSWLNAAGNFRALKSVQYMATGDLR